jgi:hypothetical protein
MNWLRYCGFTVGEMIETGWAVHNLTAGSTKEMNAGHRHDVVDDTSNHWNWEKMITLGAYLLNISLTLYLPTIDTAATLLRLYRLAVSERRARTVNFQSVDETQRREHKEAVEEWEKMDIKPRMEKGKFFSVFQSNFPKGK